MLQKFLPNILIFSDDVLIWSNTESEHLQLICEILNTLQKFNFNIKPSKILLFRDLLTYFGITIRNGKLDIPILKIQGINDYCPPKPHQSFTKVCLQYYLY